MSVTPNANALVDLATVKYHLDVPIDPGPNDNRLQAFINMSSDRISSWCDRIFQSQTYTEYHSGRRSNILLPIQYPITAIVELRMDLDRLWTDPSTLLDITKLFIHDSGQSVVYDGIFGSGYSNLRLIYTAGYTTIPTDLELACVWMVEWFYRHRTRGDMGRKTVSKGDESISIHDALPPMVTELLLQYKRMEFPSTESPVRNS
jgi:hypothetical protein